LDHPAVSQYSAATPERLDRFKDFNRKKPYASQVKPFNFMLEFYAKRPDEMARDGLLTTADDAQKQPKPIAPYSRDPYSMLPRIRDRVSGASVETQWLRTYAEALRGYHRHPETKFLNGEATDHGTTRRRHVFVEAIEDIGKEADKWDDEDPAGPDEDFIVSYGTSETDREKMLTVIKSVSKRKLAAAAHVSTRSIPETLADAVEMSEEDFRHLFEVASGVANEKQKAVADHERMMQWLVQQVDAHGAKSVAKTLAYDEANLGKIIKGKRRFSGLLGKRIGNRMTAEGDKLIRYYLPTQLN
jgi:hypothetical protein